MSLLQANVSSALIIQDKNGKKDEINPNTDVNIVSNNALSPSSNSMSVSGGTDSNGDPFSDQVSVYVVRKGDSISAIASMFNVSTNTILWANDMKKGNALKEGEVLIILPVSGV
jgi:LysM repeat protein